MNSTYHVIETQAQLDNFANELAGEKTIAVDVESDSMYHFSEKVCLLQISTKNFTYIIDPLQPIDLSGLKPIFGTEKIKKVFHGADYDIRSLYRDFKFEIKNLFDTHLACRFLGFKETGLEAVLNNLFDVSLDKRFQKKDWSQRPLPDEMIQYAAGDSIHLLPLEQILKKDLKNLNRLFWVEEECELLSKVRPARSNNLPLFLSFKGAGKLAPKELTILEALLQLRKTIAIQKDKPLFKIFQNQSILMLAKSRPSTQRQLKASNSLSPGQLEMYGKSIIETIQTASKTKKTDLPVYPKKKPRSIKGAAQNRIKILRIWKDQKAEELELDPALILTKAQITALAENHPKEAKDLVKIGVLKNWQIKEFGEEILFALS